MKFDTVQPFVLLTFSALIFPLWSHNLRIVNSDQITVIQKPMVSQAFYGWLNGEPAKFLLRSEQQFTFYAGLLVPKAPGAASDLSAKISIANDSSVKTIAFLKGKSFQWSEFYEEFAGNYYLKGPEFKAIEQPGFYVIIVSSSDNRGKFVLVVGEKEAWPLGEIFNALLLLPVLQKNFFNQPAWKAFTSRFFILFVYIPVIILFVIIAAGVLLFKRYRPNGKRV